MLEAVFIEAYPYARRAAEVRAAAAVTIGGLSAFDREDVEQEAMVGFWQALRRYDSSRACLRTYAELVISTRIASALRAYNGWKRAVPLDVLPTEVWEPAEFVDLRADVDRVLAGLDERDRHLALLLMEHTTSEASRITGISRAGIYRTINKVRTVFAAAGLRPVRQFKRRSSVRPRKPTPTKEISRPAEGFHTQVRRPDCDAPLEIGCQEAHA